MKKVYKLQLRHQFLDVNISLVMLHSDSGCQLGQEISSCHGLGGGLNRRFLSQFYAQFMVGHHIMLIPTQNKSNMLNGMH